MNEVVDWLQQLQLDKLVELLITVSASLLCITIHETCHGLMALWMGDDTAKRMGRLSLNPLRHVDPMGLIMMAIVRFGWAKAVPVNMRRFRNQKLGMALTAMAGPLSNVLLMVAALILQAFMLAIWYQTEAQILYYILLFLEYTAVLSAGLAVFNLVPIPPLDGSKILFSFLPTSAYAGLMRVERYGMIVLAALLLTNALNVPLNFLRGVLINLGNFISEPVFMFFVSHFG